MKLFNSDCLIALKQIPAESVDLVVTSPPYDNLRKYEGAGDQWNFDKFKAIAGELCRILKRGGVIVWIVADAVINGSETGSSFRQALYFKDNCKMNLHDTMIWKKSSSSFPDKIRYPQIFEYMFILSKGKPKTFNPIMVPCKCAGQEYHSTTKNMGGENGRTYKEFNINKEKIKENVWDFAIAQNKTGHPAVFPQNLIEEHIKSWSNEGDLVLDPFMGSGTTVLADKKLNRKYVGIEINEEYCNLINDRINNSINK
jgi:site-specific DNA-methyltransferase (adenine-specific)